MCPHVVVKGGGGAGGGGGGGGAGSGGGGSGGAPGGGGDGAGDGSPGAGSASPDGHEGKGKGGCPVDFVTGEVFTFPQWDFKSPGPLPLEFVRTYRTFTARRNCGLGYGWWHTYAWRARIAGRHIELIDGSGIIWQYPLIGDGESVLVSHGRRLLRYRDRIVVTTTDGTRWRLQEHRCGYYVLAKVRDTMGNSIVVDCDDFGTVGRITDSVGRVFIRRTRGTTQHWQAVVATNDGMVYRRDLITFHHDDAGHLVRTVDTAGAAWSYRYDDRHYLVEERRPDDLRFHYRYEQRAHQGKRRCVETWADLPDRDILAELGRDEVREVIPDGVRPRGAFHLMLEWGPDPDVTIEEGDGGIHRYHGNDMGLFERYVDPRGNVLTYDYDTMGNIVGASDGAQAQSLREVTPEGLLVRHVDPLGHETLYERDDEGRMVAAVDALKNRWTFAYDAYDRLVQQADPTGAVATFDYDLRGMLRASFRPDGSGGEVWYDVHGNVAIERTADGVWRYEHDLFGRLTAKTAPNGSRVDYHHDRRGDLVAIDAPRGRILLERDILGRVVRIVDPGGAVTEKRFVGDAVVEKRFPDGIARRYGFDALLRGLWVDNGAGERHLIKRDRAGFATSMKSFSGREHRLWHSPAGDLVRIEGPDGGITSFERDERGARTRIEYPDSSFEVFEHDALGRIVKAHNGLSTVELQIDALGRVVRETQSTGDFRFTAERIYDESGRLASRRYSTGCGGLLFRRSTRSACRGEEG
jgi:YD repeat-containing protein